MKRTLFCFITALVLWAQTPVRELRLITLDPAHFHVAQLHTGPLPGFSRDVRIYAPVTRDLANFWTSVSGLISHSKTPDYWRFHTYTGSDFLERMLSEKPGDVVMVSGRNARTMEYVEKSVAAGLSVLADKPWILEPRDLPKLEAVLADAKRRGVIAYDCMTQRFDIAYQLQRELVNDPELFGARTPGTPERPAVELTSSHFLLKTFNGVVNIRPAWFLDFKQQGEALGDIGTHVVDLAHWTLFPDQALDYRKDIRLLTAKRWPTPVTLDQFRRVTGEPQFPPYLRDQLNGDHLDYYANNRLLYTVRGLHVALKLTWDYESPAGDRDSMLAVYRGARSEVAVRAGREQNYLPEVDITPATETARAAVRKALDTRLQALAVRWPGLTVRESNGRLQVVIPQALRVNDVEYFLLLAQRFAGYVRKPASLPAWETPNMLAKYYITTHGVELARRSGSH